jgi:hypothetical protein
MSPTTGVRESSHSGSAVAAAWTLAGITVAFVVPWVSLYVEPNDSSPWWTTWIPLGTWIVIATFGVAQMVWDRGSRRWFGALLVLGDAVCAYVIWALAASATGGG